MAAAKTPVKSENREHDLFIEKSMKGTLAPVKISTEEQPSRQNEAANTATTLPFTGQNEAANTATTLQFTKGNARRIIKRKYIRHRKTRRRVRKQKRRNTRKSSRR